MSNEPKNNDFSKEQIEAGMKLSDEIHQMFDRDPDITTGTVMIVTLDLIRGLFCNASDPDQVRRLFFDMVRMIGDEAEVAEDLLNTPAIEQLGDDEIPDGETVN